MQREVICRYVSLNLMYFYICDLGFCRILVSLYSGTVCIWNYQSQVWECNCTSFASWLWFIHLCNDKETVQSRVILVDGHDSFLKNMFMFEQWSIMISNFS